MVDHNGVLTMQRLLLAGTLGLSMARKAAAILEGEPDSEASLSAAHPLGPGRDGQGPADPWLPEGAVLRAILDAANECLGHFDDRPPGERWCDALFQLLDLAAFAAELGAREFGGVQRFACHLVRQFQHSSRVYDAGNPSGRGHLD
jgi:hypothetical protein